LLTAAALAEVPGLISYQGTLADAGGVALDTTVAMTFSIYSDSTGGTQVWTETQPTVEVSNGVFNVLLGRRNSISDTVFNDPERWLGIAVGGDLELQPRQRLTAVGYAFQSAAGGSDGDWTIDGDNLYLINGNVGIGRDNPSSKLDIIGNARVRGKVYVDQLESTESVINIYNWDLSDWELVAASDADRFDIREYGGSPALSIEAGGNIGIGETNPSAKLDVQGPVKVGEDALGAGYDVNFYGQFVHSRFYWDAAKAALRAGGDMYLSWQADSIGLFSVATGLNANASGDQSTAMGEETTARGDWSTAMGSYSTAGGHYSTAMGNYTTASGYYSTAIGRWVTADTTDAIVIGKGMSNGDRLVNNITNSLMVGFNDTTATLFVGGADKRVGIGTTTPAAKLDVQGTFNVGVDDIGYDVNLYGADSGSGLFWDEDKMALRAGRDADGIHWAPDSIGNYSLATGYNTKASGGISTAMGRITTASGAFSTAMGDETTASGDRSTAMGLYSTASGHYSTAMGANTFASGHYSTAMGNYTTASGDYSTAMGRSTTASGDYSTAIGRWVTVDTSDAIVLGRGIDSGNPLINNITNSLMVGFNDTTATLFVGGSDHRVGIRTDSPTAKLDVEGDTGYDQFRLRTTYTPTGTADANGSAGDIAWDENYVYIKTSGGWKRAALSTF
jgi:hypothetical protein